MVNNVVGKSKCSLAEAYVSMKGARMKITYLEVAN